MHLSQANVKIFYQTLSYVGKLLYPQYPCYFFPSFLLIQTYNRLVELRKNPRFRVLPIPNKLYKILVKNQRFECDHFCLLSEELYDEYDLNIKPNWVNIVFGNESNDRSKDIVQTILTKPNASVLVPIVAVAECQKNCIFVSENCYQNWCIKYKIPDGQQMRVRLRKITAGQNLPKLAVRTTIFLIKIPYELPLDITDEIISNYFLTPRLLYRNHTYEIVLSEKQVGFALYSQYLHIFSQLKQLYFRCIHMESDNNQFEHFAIVSKGATTLHQSTSVNLPIPRKCLDDYGFVSLCPWGLLKHFNYLKSCILPFMGNNFYSSGDSPSSHTSPAPASLSFISRIHPAFLVQGARGSGKLDVVKYTARSLGFQEYIVNCAELASNGNAAQTEAKIKLAFTKAGLYEPSILVLNNFELFGIDNEGQEDLRILTIFESEMELLFTKESTYPTILIAVANGEMSKPNIQKHFLDTITIKAPNQAERFQLLQWLYHKEIVMQEVFNGCHKDFDDIPMWNGLSMPAATHQIKQYLQSAEHDVQVLKSIADQAQGFYFSDLKQLFEKSTEKLLSCRESGNLFEMDRCLDMEVFEKHLSDMQGEFTDSLGAPKVPRVLWSDIGGLAKLKEEIQNSIGLPLKHIHLMGKNLRRSGILLYGPPGTGKTLVAKAVATECNLSFLSVQGPELLNMYVGQSEQNVREVFERARMAAPCVIFLDELDSLAPNRGAAGDSGGVMDRVVSQLLAEMDDMSGGDDDSKQLFILAATNRPDLIDPALLRPGRFDKLLFVGPYVTKEDKMAVLKAQMKKFNLKKGLTLDDIAGNLKQDMSGADIYSVCSNAWLNAVRRAVATHSTEDNVQALTADDVYVNLDDFRQAITKFVPSINKKDMAYYNNLRSTYNTAK